VSIACGYPGGVRAGEPVTIVIPSYRDAGHLRALLASLRETTDPALARVVVADDASGAEHVAELRAMEGIEVVAGEENRGFAANVNRGLERADPAHDVVVLNSDVVALPGWLERLQAAAGSAPGAGGAPAVGAVGPKLLYPDRRIQSAGTTRYLEAPLWFDHRHRFRPAGWPPANVAVPVLAITGACMYLTREALDAVGPFDERYGMSYEDVDWCLRAWSAGFEVRYEPGAELTHLESQTRGTVEGERELASQRLFWERWGEPLDARPVRHPDGRLRVVLVEEPGGGSRTAGAASAAATALRERGHHVETRPPDDPALARMEAVKVATGPRSASAVWSASVTHGVGVQLIHEDAGEADAAWFREELAYGAPNERMLHALRELRLFAALTPPGDAARLDALIEDAARPRRVELTEELQRLLGTLQGYRARYDALQRSASWQLSAPLRRVKRRLRPLADRLRLRSAPLRARRSAPRAGRRRR
jgi:GT2 family glycosyltransferase